MIIHCAVKHPQTATIMRLILYLDLPSDIKTYSIHFYDTIPANLANWLYHWIYIAVYGEHDIISVYIKCIWNGSKTEMHTTGTETMLSDKGNKAFVFTRVRLNCFTRNFFFLNRGFQRGLLYIYYIYWLFIIRVHTWWARFCVVYTRRPPVVARAAFCKRAFTCTIRCTLWYRILE